MENASEPEAPENVHTDKRSYKIYQPYHTPEKKSRKTHPKIPPQFDTLPADNEAPRHTPSRQRSTSAHPLPIKPQGNSAFRSTPSSAALTAHPHSTPHHHPNPTALNLTARAGDAVWSASAGGELILGWRKSALFFKSPLSERLQDASSDFWKTLLADSRQPRIQPPTKPQTRQHPRHGRTFTPTTLFPPK